MIVEYAATESFRKPLTSYWSTGYRGQLTLQPELIYQGFANGAGTFTKYSSFRTEQLEYLLLSKALSLIAPQQDIPILMGGIQPVMGYINPEFRGMKIYEPCATESVTFFIHSETTFVDGPHSVWR